jgi:hypothetical protein
VCPALCGLISPKKKRGVSRAPVSEYISYIRIQNHFDEKRCAMLDLFMWQLVTRQAAQQWFKLITAMAPFGCADKPVGKILFWLKKHTYNR